MDREKVPNDAAGTTQPDLLACRTRLQMLQRIGGLGYFEWNIRDGNLACSGEFEALYGLDKRGFPCDCDAWLKLVHPEDRQEAEKRIHGALETGSFEAEWRIILPDGSIRWLGGRGSLFRDAAGNPECLVGVHIDITPQKTLEKQLNDSNMFLERVMQSICSAVFVLDRERRFVQLNAAGFDLFGYGCEEIIGRPFHLIFEKMAMQQLEEPLQTVLVHGRRLESLEIDILRKDGSRRTVSLSAMPLVDDVSITGIVGVAADVTERRRTELLLRNSEERYRTMFNSVNDGIFIHCAHNGRILDVNLRAQEMYGYSREEMCGMSVEELSGPGFEQRHALQVMHRVAAGEPELFEWVGRHRSGATFWVEVNLKKVVLEGAERLLAVVRDITERKHALEALRESEEKFRALADNIAQLAWIADAAGNIIWFNKRWYDYTGTTPQENEHGGWQQVQHPEHLDAVVEKLNRCLRAGDFWEDTMPLRGGDGSYRWFLSRAIPIRDERGRVTRWFGTNTDITERREMEESLRSAEERLSLAQQAAGIGMWTWEVGAEHPTFSENYCSVMGIERPPGSFEDFLDMLHPDDRLAVRKQFETAMTEGEQYESEFRVLTEDEPERWIMGRGRVFTDETGRAARISGIVFDITDQKQYEEELKRTMDELARSNRELEQFAYVASHDLKEPLRMIASYVLLLEKKYRGRLDGKADQYIHFAVDGADRMNRLIDGLLSYSRITLRREEFGVVDANGAFAAAVANLEEAIREAGAAVSRDSLPQVRGDETQLAQLLQNLISNGLKYRKKGVSPQVHVTAHREGKVWVFAVQDNGIGIDPEHHERIFQIFQRLHTQEEYAGTGIGLASCKKIVEHHHGRIWLESTPGNGSTFFFSIPLEREPPARNTVRPPPRSEPKK